SKNSKGDLCFEPLFATTVLHDEPIQIKYIRMRRLDVDALNVSDDQSSTVSSIIPIDEYYIIEKGQKICLNDDNPNLKQSVSKPIKPQPLRVSISGVDDKKEEYVYFYHRFDYPYIPE
ncbi:hypothetical protein, partial [Psychrobacter celer]|uniref:hypothetical protein n=1 Tax=Psychrobacter celer TaxID=306572 RepID=UPI003FD40A88